MVVLYVGRMPLPEPLLFSRATGGKMLSFLIVLAEAKISQLFLSISWQDAKIFLPRAPYII
jgi:hypothetical protein